MLEYELEDVLISIYLVYIGKLQSGKIDNY